MSSVAGEGIGDDILERNILRLGGSPENVETIKLSRAEIARYETAKREGRFSSYDAFLASDETDPRLSVEYKKAAMLIHDLPKIDDIRVMAARIGYAINNVDSSEGRAGGEEDVSVSLAGASSIQHRAADGKQKGSDGKCCCS